MLSRVAETIYWIGRYQERAENTARLITVNTNLMLDLPPKVAPGWDALIHLLGCYEFYLERHPEFTERRVANFLISDESNPSSIISTLSALRENARTIREILPREAWESINSYYQTALESKQSSFSRPGRQSYLQHIITGSQLMTGLLAGSMNHDTAYYFLNLGRKLKRADMTTRIIDVCSENPLPEEPPKRTPLKAVKQIDHRLAEMSMDKMDNHVLHDFIDDFQIDFGTLHEAISKAYFPPTLMSAA
jgi:uncharacterized alpha-E superfamily protein